MEKNSLQILHTLHYIQNKEVLFVRLRTGNRRSEVGLIERIYILEVGGRKSEVRLVKRIYIIVAACFF